MTTTQDNWKELVATALVGTSRRAPKLDTTDDALGDVLTSLNTHEPERYLLSAAAAIALHREAGRDLQTRQFDLPEPCDLDDLPYVSARASRRLIDLVTKSNLYNKAIREWLTRVARSGKRVPEQFVPELLSFGVRTKDMRPIIVDVVGKRGRWLAQFNPQWGYAAASSDEADWQQGKTEARAWLLRQMRRVNPLRGRQLLESTWAEEGTDDRAEFLRVLSDGLSLDDESFLESVLDERSERTRSAAVQLLVRLRGSGLHQRMVARVRSFVGLDTTEDGAYRLHLAQPGSYDDSLRRDGIKPDPPKSKQDLDPGVYWVIEMLGSVPPDEWLPEHLTVTELVQAVANSDYPDELTEALALAALRYRDIGVAEYLLRGNHEHIVLDWGLMDVLDADTREQIIIDVLDANDEMLYPNHPVLRLVNLTADIHHEWSLRLTNHFIERLGAMVDAATIDQLGAFVNWLNPLSLYMNPALAYEAAEALGNREKHKDDNSYMYYNWQQAVNTFNLMMKTRKDMLEELADEHQ